MLTEYVRNGLLNHLFRGVPFEAPSSIFIGLITADGEVSAPEYERIEIPCTEESFEIDLNESKITSTQNLSFAFPEIDWTTVQRPITRYGIFDALEGGELIDGGDLAASVHLPAESPNLVILAGQITFQLGS